MDQEDFEKILSCFRDKDRIDWASANPEKLLVYLRNCPFSGKTDMRYILDKLMKDQD